MSVPEYPSISKQNPVFPEYLDFEKLRAIGIAHLQQMSGKLWTDYNLHDPGITILEVLCYAVTELGYRNNLDIRDLLAKDPANSTKNTDNNFFTPDQILTCNPVTELDLRKRLLDIAGVRNAWIKRFEDYKLVRETVTSPWIVNLQPNQKESTQEEIQIKGLYTVLLDLDPPTYRDACGQFYKPWSTILDSVKTVLYSHRNLCEDIHELIVLGEETVGVRSEIELDANVDANDVAVEIFIRIQGFLAPQIKFYSLQELLDRGKNPGEIFAGRPSAIAAHDKGSPYSHASSHGFIDTEELDALTLPTQIHTSDLYRIILDIPGVLTVKTLSICSFINGLAQSQEQHWYLDLTPSYRPILGIEQSRLSIYKAGLPTAIDMETVNRRYAQQKLTHLKAKRGNAELDLPIPQGTYHATLHEHYSIHHDFPLTYGISEDGLPATASDKRKAQADQLKGYLVFFDQILANYLVQLSHIRELFSSTDTQAHTYFTQTLNFPGVEDILNSTNNDKTSSNSPPSYVEKEFQSFLEGIIEDQDLLGERRNRFLDHMLARFAESFTDYVLLNYRINSEFSNADSITREKEFQSSVIQDKTKFLQDYPQLSRDRFRAANIACQTTHHRCYTSGFERRVARLLGIKTGSTEQTLVRFSSTPQGTQTGGYTDEGLYAIEHVLLRPRQTDVFQTDNGLSMLPIPTMPRRVDENGITAASPLPLDPYSFWISVILPVWPRRFQDWGFRQFVESTLRAEAPAHVALKIAWVSLRSMQRFEQAYRAWINQLSLMNCEDQNCGQAQARNDLLQVLSELQSVYPVATLDGPATPGLIQNPVILNQTPLGSTYE